MTRLKFIKPLRIAQIIVDTPENCPHYNAYHDYITHKISKTFCTYPLPWRLHDDYTTAEPCNWDKCPLVNES